MSKPNFTWNPDLGARQTFKPNVTVTKFGDGYALRVPVGINSKPKSWNVTFTTNLATATDILTFLNARGGVEPFAWVDPMNIEATYTCAEWSSSQQNFGIYVVTATFEQVFDL